MSRLNKLRIAWTNQLLWAGALWLAACGGTSATDQPESPKGAEVVESTQVRLTLDELGSANTGSLVAGNTAFAWKLYAQLAASQDENVMFSPHSVSTALGMAYVGARGATADEMAHALSFELQGEELHAAFNKLDQELASRGKDAVAKDGTPFKLRVVNQLWGQQGYTFVPEFLGTLSKHYGAKLFALDFESEPEPSRLIINEWVEEQTAQKIKDLIPGGGVTTQTRLVLTNAVYFNAAWLYPFVTDSTREQTFTKLDGSQVQAPFMHQTEELRYARGEDWAAVELPYSGNETSMVIIVPDAGKFAQVEPMLATVSADAIQQLRKADVALSLPKFKVEGAFGLRDALTTLGMGSAFVDADFSGIDGARELQIADVLHKTFIEVDEEGTEAAAATAVVFRAVSAPVVQVELTVDRPFIALIRDNATGAILFIAKVISPAT